MKTIKSIALLSFVFLLAFTSCKKENDFGGKAKIAGTVKVNGAAVQNAIVYMYIGDAAGSTYDGSAVTNGSGQYTISGLLRGKYFVNAQYTNSTGQVFKCTGTKVTIGDKKGTVTADLTLE